VAQLAAHRSCKAVVRGSSPLTGSLLTSSYYVEQPGLLAVCQWSCQWIRLGHGWTTPFWWWPRPRIRPQARQLLPSAGLLGRRAGRGIDHLRVGRTPGTGVDVGLDLVRSPHAELVELLRSYEPTAVINCAGAVRGTAGEMMRTNVASVHSLVSAAWSAAPTARIVQLGSSAEYGAQDGQRPTNESAEARPSSPYGYSKLAGTQIALHAQSQGLAVTVLRIFNVSGPLSPTSTMLGGAVMRLRSGETLIVDSLDGWRDYVDVRDVAAAAIATTSTPDAPPLMNIGSGQAVRTGDWLQRLIEISETRAEPVEAPTLRERTSPRRLLSHGSALTSPSPGAPSTGHRSSPLTSP
jgi:NDP-hexose 4-ketoreductase